MIAALVLAAGRSERMGRPKALLPLPDGRSFLETVLDTLAACGVLGVRVVLGHDAEAVSAAVGLPFEAEVENLEWERGMLSSVQAGVRALPAEATGMLLWPVDHPLVREGTLTRILSCEGRAPVVVPVHGGKRGHPSLFHADTFSELLAAPQSVGARAVVLAHAPDRLDLEVDDPGVVADLDSPQAYLAFTGRPFPAEDA